VVYYNIILNLATTIIIIGNMFRLKSQTSHLAKVMG
jgi:hypothetical protein